MPYLPLDGDAPPVLNNNYYALSKVFAEQMLEGMCDDDAEMTCTVLRLPWVPRINDLWWANRKAEDKRPGPRAIAAKLVKRQSPPGRHLHHTPAEALTYLMGDDVAGVIDAALGRQRPGYHRYFPSQSFAVRGYTTEQVIAEWFGDVPSRTVGQQPDRVVDLDRLESELGWTPAQPPVEMPPPW